MAGQDGKRASSEAGEKKDTKKAKAVAKKQATIKQRRETLRASGVFVCINCEHTEKDLSMRPMCC